MCISVCMFSVVCRGLRVLVDWSPVTAKWRSITSRLISGCENACCLSISLTYLLPTHSQLQHNIFFICFSLYYSYIWLTGGHNDKWILGKNTQKIFLSNVAYFLNMSWHKYILILQSFIFLKSTANNSSEFSWLLSYFLLYK